MKKLLCMMACLVLAMTMLTACGKKDENNEKVTEKVVTMDVSATADALIKDIKFVDDMSKVEDIEFFSALFSVDSEDIKGQLTYTSSGATAEVVSAVECTDKEAAKRVEEAFKAYTKAMSEAYADYTPTECAKLDNPVIKVYEKYVIMCVSDDNDTAVKTIEGQVK